MITDEEEAVEGPEAGAVDRGIAGGIEMLGAKGGLAELLDAVAPVWTAARVGGNVEVGAGVENALANVAEFEGFFFGGPIYTEEDL